MADLKQHGGDPEKITDAAIDMSKAFIKGVKEHLPNAETTFDPFHVIKSMNDALAKIRAEEARLQNVYFAESRQEAETLLTCWHSETDASSIGLIQKMAKTVKEHWKGILSHFDSKLATGFLEGINSLIQAAKARARGYRNPQNLISLAYIIAGKLKFKSLHNVPI